MTRPLAKLVLHLCRFGGERPYMAERVARARSLSGLKIKSYLRTHGWTEAQQIKLRHDLIAAFDAAVVHGFKPGHPAEQTMAQVLSPHHQDMSLRCLTTGGEGVMLFLLDKAIAATRILLVRLFRQGVDMAD